MNNINPGTINASFHSLKRVNGNAMSTYYFFGFEVFKDIHLLFMLVGPFGICHAMNLYQIEIIGF